MGVPGVKLGLSVMATSTLASSHSASLENVLLNPGSVVEEKGNSGLGAQDHSGVEHFSPANHIPLCFGPKGQ